MVDFLNDDVAFEGTATHEGELIANGTLTIGPGGLSFGDPTTTPATSWLAHVRVQIPNVAARAALVAWRTANAPISADNPLLVWRADGSLTGVNEITLNGTDWYAESPLSGDIELTLATSASFGWLLMQGQLLANAAVNYPALWAAAHPVLREGSALRIPDMRGRAAIGAGQGAGLSLRNLGDITGNETVALNTTQMPSHNHTGTTDNNTVNAHVANGDASSNPGTPAAIDRGDSSGGAYRTIQDSAHQHSFTTSSVGGGAAHPNMQPSLALNFKVKV